MSEFLKQEDKKNPMCYFCNKLGHISHYCDDVKCLCDRLNNRFDSSVYKLLLNLNHKQLAAIFAYYKTVNIDEKSYEEIYDIVKFLEVKLVDIMYAGNMLYIEVASQFEYARLEEEFGTEEMQNHAFGCSVDESTRLELMREFNRNRFWKPIANSISSTTKENFTCYLCLDEKENGTKVKICSCNGYQCYTCFGDYYKKNKNAAPSCPMCRTQIANCSTVTVENPDILPILQDLIQ